jgi:hypothetical protein
MKGFPRIDVYRWQEQNGLTVRNIVEIHVDGARIGGLQGYTVEEHYNTVGKATLHLQGELTFHQGKPGGNHD